MTINSVTIEGNLTKDPESKAGGSVVKIRLAVNDRVKDKDTGEWTDRPNYFDVTAFGKTAEWALRDLSRGDGCTVSGKLRWREWQTDDGSKRQSVEVIADRIVPSRLRQAKDAQPDAFASAAAFMDEFDDAPPF